MTVDDTAVNSRRHWWQKPFRLFQTNLREIDAALDAETTAEQIDASGFNVWLLNAGGIAYFYPPTEPRYQRAAPSLADRADGDLVAAAVAACRSRGMTLVGRFDFSRLPTELTGAHSEWAYVDANGRHGEEDGLTRLCPTSDYHRTIVPRVLEDFVRRYDVGGVFFNWLNFPEVAYDGEYGGPCHCPRCVEQFAAATGGAPHPSGPSDETYDLWVEHSRQYIQRLAQSYRDTIRAVRTDLAVFLADAHLDLEFLETNSFLGALESSRWWAHTPSELVSVQRGRDPEVRAIVHASANLGLPYRMSDEEPAQFRRYAAQALARGGEPGAVVIGPPHEEVFPSLRRVGDLLRVHRDNAGLYEGLRQTAPVGLIRPAAGTALASMQSRAVFDGYRGLFTAMQERHVPFDVVGSDCVAGTSLERLRLLVLPDGVDLDAEAREAVDEWVGRGGRLLATGVQLYESGRVGLACLPAQEATTSLDGVELAGRYVGGAERGLRWPVLGYFHKAGSFTDADLWLSTRAPFGPPEKAHGWAPMPEWPAVLRGDFKRGRVTQFPWSAGETVWRSGLTSLADFIVGEALELLGPAPVSGTFPRHVELTFGAVNDGTLIHLVNHGGGRPDRVREPSPASGVIHLVGMPRPAAVRSLTRDTVLQERSGAEGGVDILVDDFELLEAIHVTY